jgi:glycosyltransferase involved in cell wall biosynthesis
MAVCRTNPDVSVVVPVRNRAGMLRDLLEALDGQTYRSFEVVVVDDGSDDGTVEVTRDAVVAERPVVTLHSKGEGTLEARQFGAHHSEAPVLAFTDSDCIPDREWLAHVMAAMDDGADVVHGLTRPTRPLWPMERSVEAGDEGLFPTCNIAYRKTLYQELRGFDADTAASWRFGAVNRRRDSAFGEDTLLGWRSVRSGADVRYVPEAIVEHQVFAPDLTDFLVRTAKTAAFPAMIRELPELRATLLKGRVFLGDYARLPVYLTVLALLLRRPRLALGTTAWWVWNRADALRRAPQPTLDLLPWLPAQMAADVATAAALLAGSIRSGTPVL